MQIAPGVHRVTHGISNFYLVEDAGKVVLIDAGVTGDWELFNQALTSLGRTLADVQAVLLTHAHSDHTGFAERARTSAHATVWVHEADVLVAKGAKPAKQERGAGSYLLHAEAWRTIFGLMAHGGINIVPILEVARFADGQTLDLAGRPQVVHVPGHTAGMAAIFLDQRRILFTGDALVTRNPLTGRRGPQIMPRGLNVNSEQALKSLGRLEGLGADIVLPGHGEAWTEGVGFAVLKARAAGLS
jgi:glyoxylase-like metal-dependent hydrolase (beta-lactamase superfamily II)